MSSPAQDDLFLMLTEHPPQGVGNLPEGGVTFHCLNEERHEILTAVCGLLKPAQYTRDLRVVPLRTERLQPGDLLTLQVGIDTQERRR